MEASDHLEQYTALLRIRHAAARRNLCIMELLFLGFTVGTHVIIWFAYPGHWPIYVAFTLVTIWGGLGFIATRLEHAC